MENDGRNICNIGAGYEHVKDYCKAVFNTPDASCITEPKTMRKTGLCYKSGGSYFQQNWTDNSRKKFHTNTTKP